MKLFYTSPANSWLNGLPIGNGRLAAMVQDTEHTDEITLNHEWLYAAGTKERHAKQHSQYLPFIRKLFKEGHHYEGALFANFLYTGDIGILQENPERLQSPAMAAEVDFNYFAKKNEYIERTLNLENGIVTIKRQIDGVIVTSRYFANCETDLLSFEWTAEDKFSGELTLTRMPEWSCFVEPKKCNDSYCKLDALIHTENALLLRGILTDNVGNGEIKFENRLVYKTDGETEHTEIGIKVINATYIYAVINIATSAKNNSLLLDDNSCVMPENWGNAKLAHIKKFSSIMNRVKFTLGNRYPTLNKLTTSERVALMKEGNSDNGICELYFNFGRYLMLSGTMNAELPTHLQGKWNNQIQPAWDSDYHLDINLQMNYWAAESINMPEAAKGLVNYLNLIKSIGQESAKNLFGCRGIHIPLSTDIWGGHCGTYGWTAWTGAAAWLAQHIWWHYIYSGNKEFLRNEAYDYFVQVAEFYEDFLEKGDDGIYHICPSYSPECPIAEQPSLPVGICSDAAMDIQLIFDALNYAIRSAQILDIDEEKVAPWQEILNNLPPFKIGTDGRLMEWDNEYTEKEPGHRHLSHLYGLYPSNLFTPETRTQQYNAAIRSLEFRMANGGGHTGWSRAWCACLFARIKRSNEFYEHYTELIKEFATETLLDLHPPRIFQIDGNLGGIAAVVEAIVGYYDNKAHILPALPEAWSDGAMSGIKIPGGHTVEVKWENGKATEISVILGFEEKVTITYENKSFTLTGKVDEIKKLYF